MSHQFVQCGFQDLQNLQKPRLQTLQETGWTKRRCFPMFCAFVWEPQVNMYEVHLVHCGSLQEFERPCCVSFTGCVSMLKSTVSFRTNTFRCNYEAKHTSVHSDDPDDRTEMTPVTASELAQSPLIPVDSGGEPSAEMWTFSLRISPFRHKLHSQQHLASKTV